MDLTHLNHIHQPGETSPLICPLKMAQNGHQSTPQQHYSRPLSPQPRVHDTTLPPSPGFHPTSIPIGSFGDNNLGLGPSDLNLNLSNGYNSTIHGNSHHHYNNGNMLPSDQTTQWLSMTNVRSGPATTTTTSGHGFEQYAQNDPNHHYNHASPQYQPNQPGQRGLDDRLYDLTLNHEEYMRQQHPQDLSIAQNQQQQQNQQAPQQPINYAQKMMLQQQFTTQQEIYQQQLAHTQQHTQNYIQQETNSNSPPGSLASPPIATTNGRAKLVKENSSTLDASQPQQPRRRGRPSNAYLAEQEAQRQKHYNVKAEMKTEGSDGDSEQDNHDQNGEYGTRQRDSTRRTSTRVGSKTAIATTNGAKQATAINIAVNSVKNGSKLTKKSKEVHAPAPIYKKGSKVAHMTSISSEDEEDGDEDDDDDGDDNDDDDGSDQQDNSTHGTTHSTTTTTTTATTAKAVNGKQRQDQIRADRLARKAERARTLRRERLDRLEVLEKENQLQKTQLIEYELVISHQKQFISQYQYRVQYLDGMLEAYRNNVGDLTPAVKQQIIDGIESDPSWGGKTLASLGIMSNPLSQQLPEGSESIRNNNNNNNNHNTQTTTTTTHNSSPFQHPITTTIMSDQPDGASPHNASQPSSLPASPTYGHFDENNNQHPLGPPQFNIAPSLQTTNNHPHTSLSDLPNFSHQSATMTSPQAQDRMHIIKHSLNPTGLDLSSISQSNTAGLNVNNINVSNLALLDPNVPLPSRPASVPSSTAPGMGSTNGSLHSQTQTATQSTAAGKGSKQNLHLNCPAGNKVSVSADLDLLHILREQLTGTAHGLLGAIAIINDGITKQTMEKHLDMLDKIAEDENKDKERLAASKKR